MVAAKEEEAIVGRSAEETMMSIERSRAHREQREAWADELKEMEAERSGHEEEARHVTGEAYRVASMALVFQAVLFTAVAQSARLHCSLAWSPVTLSVMSVAASTIAMATKFCELSHLHHSLRLSADAMAHIVSSLEKLEREGSGMDLHRELLLLSSHKSSSSSSAPSICDLLSPHRLSPLLFLLAISIVVSYFSARILCQNL